MPEYMISESRLMWLSAGTGIPHVWHYCWVSFGYCSQLKNLSMKIINKHNQLGHEHGIKRSSRWAMRWRSIGAVQHELRHKAASNIEGDNKRPLHEYQNKQSSDDINVSFLLLLRNSSDIRLLNQLLKSLWSSPCQIIYCNVWGSRRGSQLDLSFVGFVPAATSHYFSTCHERVWPCNYCTNSYKTYGTLRHVSKRLLQFLGDHLAESSSWYWKAEHSAARTHWDLSQVLTIFVLSESVTLRVSPNS